ncbi:hypothetical protein B0H13DRAFT_2323228 [Mycena leptocephala]|nr:hypothetical protein B0H13DRAFT_2323228 [Mycena leptocephala]
MDPQEALRRLREQAENTPHLSVPHLRPKKSLQGTSSFSSTDPSTQAFLSIPSVNLRQPAVQPTPSAFSSLQFRPIITPDSLPRSSSLPNAVRTTIPFPISSSTASHHDDPFQSTEPSSPSPDYTDQELDGLSPDALPFRRRRSTDTYTKIHNLLAGLRQDRISPIDILIQVLDPNDMVYDRYRGKLYREDSTKLSALIERIMADYKGKKKLLGCMQPHLEDFACEIVAEEMETRRRNSILPGIEAVTPTYFVFQRRRLAVSSRNATTVVSIIEPLPCIPSGIWAVFLWSTGSARQTIDAAFRWEIHSYTT